MIETHEEGTWEDRLVVERNYAGWRLDCYLAEKLRRATRSKASRIIREGVRLEDGRRARPGVRLREGDVVVLPRVEQADPETPPLTSARVLLERPDVVVIDKPAGMLVHRTAGEATRTVEALLAARFSGERVESAHRLDRDTSGCMVAGRGLDAIRALRTLFAGSEVTKTYTALVRDPGRVWLPGAARTLDTPLGFDAASTVRLRVGAGSWPCATHARCERRRGELALLDVTIDGGRQHQIRAHLALAGTPVLGDKLYEAGDAFFLDWIDRPGAPDLVARLPARWHCLHARAVSLPWRGEQLAIEAPLPSAIGALLDAQPDDR